VREPKVFLFDEPLSNLDAELRVQMRLEIAKLHSDLGATMIYVTHDQVEAMTLADKIVVLRAGRIEQVGAPLELYSDPDNIFVAGFIGSPKMNFLNAKVQSTQGGSATVTLSELKGDAFTVPGISAAQAGQEVIVGIRPEHFDPAGSAHIEAHIDVIEHLGGVSYGYAGAGGDDPLTIGLGEADTAKPGADYIAHFSPERAFLFDPKTSASGGVGSPLLGQERIQRLGIRRRPQLGNADRIAQNAGDARQGLQMIGAGTFRRQQQKHDVDRLVVERLEIDRFVQPRENAGNAIESRGICHAEWQCPCPRRSNQGARAAGSCRKWHARKAGYLRSLFRQCLQQLFLGADPQIWNNCFLR
jgi:hypothetical protein